MKHISRRDLLWILPLSLGLGSLLSFLQGGAWLVGWISFSLLFLAAIVLLTIATRWAEGGRLLLWLVALAFGLRLAGGVATYLLLPSLGYDESDDQAGFVFTDAHRRDDQAWELASSPRSILDAFSEKYAYDQYGGLLAFSGLVYRYLSPDAHRPLLLVLLSALLAALGLPFLWKAANQQWGPPIAVPAAWIYTLYPESLLLGGSAMREPYLIGLSALALWGFVDWHKLGSRSGWIWIGVSLAGMLLVSPAAALITLLVLAGWLYFSGGQRAIPWWVLAAAALVFIGGLFVLSSGLDPEGNLGAVTPFGVVNNWLRRAVKWNLYQIVADSGRVQLIFEQIPEWLRLPFVAGYGVFQPVLPATFFEPTTALWQWIGILRALGWYALLPLILFSTLAALASLAREAGETPRIWIWFSVMVWSWILLAALRGGGDQWDNPRYRAILFLWQALLAAYGWAQWRNHHSPWYFRILAMEIVFVLVWGHWYATRYLRFGSRLPFAWMVALIFGAWILIALAGWLWDRKRRA